MKVKSVPNYGGIVLVAAKNLVLLFDTTQNTVLNSIKASQYNILKIDNLSVYSLSFQKVSDAVTDMSIETMKIFDFAQTIAYFAHHRQYKKAISFAIKVKDPTKEELDPLVTCLFYFEQGKKALEKLL